MKGVYNSDGVRIRQAFECWAEEMRLGPFTTPEEVYSARPFMGRVFTGSAALPVKPNQKYICP